MLKHTPGPWRADGCQIYAGLEVVPHSGWGVAEAYPGQNREEGEANARLIAAAPDLFDLCNKAVVMLGHPVKDKELDDLREWILEVVIKLDPPHTRSS